MFRILILITLSCAIGAADGLAKTPTHKSMAEPRAAMPANCLDSSRLLSHIAFTVAGAPGMKSCSQLLSTDTLIAVRHWGRT
jgi:hypothetical protein